MRESENQDLTPDSLLAFAKDHRYIQQCQRLLQNVFRRDSSEDSVDLWWWSALLYATLVIRRKERTLGMEVMGLHHVTFSPWQRRVGIMCLAVGWGLWFRHCIREEHSLQEEARHEALRGAARRSFHQQQRDAMLQRASRMHDTGDSTTVPSTSVSRSAPTESVHPFTNWKQRMRQLILHFSEILSAAIVSSSDTPHALPDTGTLISIGRWILRLHLAHYCLTGQYPTLLHRLFKLRVDRKQSSRLSDPPPTTHHLVGELILVQAAATLVHSLARWYVSYRPSKRIARLPLGEDEPESQEETIITLSSPTAPLCGICRMPRVESAASSTCGHIFCWKCLYEWVSTNRPECPLCRSPCRPQDIVAIYNYAPS